MALQWLFKFNVFSREGVTLFKVLGPWSFRAPGPTIRLSVLVY